MGPALRTVTALRCQGAGRAEPVFRELAISVVAAHADRMRLESASADRVGEMREVLRGVAGSFKPLPGLEESRVGRAFAPVPALFDHWAR